MIKRLVQLLKASLVLVAGLCASVATIEAKAGPRVNAENQAKTSLDFQLSDGRDFVRLSKLPPRLTVLNFWRADCPPCVREMPVLAELAREGKARVVTVALQRPAETLTAPAVVLAALSPPLISLNGPSEARGLLARFGNPHGALPHTVLLDARRKVCAQHTGEIGEDWLRNAVSHCVVNEGEP